MTYLLRPVPALLQEPASYVIPTWACRVSGNKILSKILVEPIIKFCTFAPRKKAQYIKSYFIEIHRNTNEPNET